MRRRGSRLLAVALMVAVAAVGCGSSKPSSGSEEVSAAATTPSTTIPSTTAPSSTTPSTAGSTSLEGTYALDLTCDTETKDHATLIVHDGRGTLTLASDGVIIGKTDMLPFEGPVDVQGTTFGFDVERVGALIQIDGTVSDDGNTINGSGYVGNGIRQGTCQIAFTGHRGSSSGTPTTTGTTSTTAPSGTGSGSGTLSGTYAITATITCTGSGGLAGTYTQQGSFTVNGNDGELVWAPKDDPSQMLIPAGQPDLSGRVDVGGTAFAFEVFGQDGGDTWVSLQGTISDGGDAIVGSGELSPCAAQFTGHRS